MKLSYEAIQAFLFAEARAQQEKRWEDWLACYAPDVTYHVPCWDDDDKLTTDPRTEVSLIYYPNKNGLEDRVFRIETERSSATVPDTRYNRSISNIEVLAQDENQVDLCFNWTTLAFRYDVVDTYFGTARYLLDTSGPKPLIKRKLVVLKNDYIHHLLDVYHV
jgi:benzoate/toluate 1,2-dioxygenase beta subunit